MKFTKTIIGKVAFIETNKNVTDSLKFVPKNCRLLKRWELLKLFDEENEVCVKIFPLHHYLLCSKNRACWLSNFYFNSSFDANGRDVDYYYALRGVCVVKK